MIVALVMATLALQGAVVVIRRTDWRCIDHELRSSANTHANIEDMDDDHLRGCERRLH